MRPASSTPAAASGRAAAGYAPLRQPRGGDKHWGQMGGAEQAAVMTLGWTAASWDAGDEEPLQGAWEELGPAQRWAAEALGYKSTEFGRASLAEGGAAAASNDEEELGLSLEAPDSVEEPVVCPNATEKADCWLTDNETGEPTLLFRAAQLSCWLYSAATCAGTFYTPSLAEAYELRDPLLGGAVLMLALMFGPGFLLVLAEARRVCRCTGEEAPLPRLGAGTALLSAERHAGLKTQFDRLDPNSRRSWVERIVFVVLFGLFIVTGWGAHSPWQNRCTATTYLLFNLLAAHIAGAIWPATLHIAIQLITTEIDAIAAALEQELKTKGTDMTLEQWEETVVEPVRGLIRDLETLSDGWAKGAVANMLFNAGNVCAWFCLALSPSLGPWAVEQTGVEWVDTLITGYCAFMVVLNLINPLVLLGAPAALSTACDDLKEKLNAVRISDLSPEIDARLIILERAMANVNHGQGVGFDVKGIVIDNKMLTMMAVKLYAAGSAAGTAILAYSAYAPGAAAAAGGAQCELSAMQLAGIQAAMMGRNDSCAYNMTVADAIGA
eukprot:COSAG04_NODE_246_length_18912_cov_7.669537_11_plen_553_part_00